MYKEEEEAVVVHVVTLLFCLEHKRNSVEIPLVVTRALAQSHE